jgi:retron-type reverse transcriptase
MKLVLLTLLNTKLQYGESNQLIPVENGVPQGGIFSPMLFNITLDWILKEDHICNLKMKERKILGYADDLLILCDNNTSLGIRTVHILNKAGLNTNKNK